MVVLFPDSFAYSCIPRVRLRPVPADVDALDMRDLAQKHLTVSMLAYRSQEQLEHDRDPQSLITP